jgi:hypothetical protein
MTPLAAASLTTDQARARSLRRLDLLGLVVLGLAANALAARFITQPGYADAYYYFGGARQLAEGRGFAEPYVWNYLTPVHAVAPGAALWPSHLYWMPLASIVAAPFLFVARAAGATANATLFRAAQLPFTLLAAALPVLAYGVAHSATGTRRHALAAGLLTLFSPFYFPYWTTTDAFALYALTGAGALVLAARAAARPQRAGRWLFGAGVAAGLAHLARADGLLILLCVLLWLAWRGPRRASQFAALLAGYAVSLAPWFARNLLVIGAPLAPTAARTLWLTNYDDLFTYTPAALTPAAYLAWGVGPILLSKWSALVDNFESLVAVQCAILVFPFVVAGLWQLRRQPLMQLAVLYAAALLAAMTLVFTFPGARGGYFHSGAALLPFLMPAAAAGLDAAVRGAARLLPHWQPERSQPVFAALLVLCVLALTSFIFWKRVFSGPSWAGNEQVYAQAGGWLKAQGQGGAVVAANDPPGWYYWTGQPAIVIPNGDSAVLQQAMTELGARWVVLDANRPAALAGLYDAPQAAGSFALRATFRDGAGQPVYLLERDAGP